MSKRRQILALIVIDCSYLRFHTFFTLGPTAQLFASSFGTMTFDRCQTEYRFCSVRDNENDPSKSCSTVPNLHLGAIYERPKITKWIYRTSSRTSTDSERANDVRYPSCDFLAKSHVESINCAISEPPYLKMTKSIREYSQLGDFAKVI